MTINRENKGERAESRARSCADGAPVDASLSAPLGAVRSLAGASRHALRGSFSNPTFSVHSNRLPPKKVVCDRTIFLEIYSTVVKSLV